MYLLPTEKYPEYWFTPGVVSQMPEFLTNLTVDCVAACSKTLYVTPSSTTTDRLSFNIGDAKVRLPRASPANNLEKVRCILMAERMSLSRKGTS